MKKLIAFMLALLMATGCAFAAAENSETKISSSDGAFTISFQLPEGVTMLNGEWDAAGTLYQANLQGHDGLYFYLAVAAPVAAEGADAEEIAPVTYNEDNGYTDEYMKNMLQEMFADDAEYFDIDVLTTAYGTKLGIIRINDEEAPSTYIMSVWQGYEIGVTVMNVEASTGEYRAVTDEQVQKVVDFLSEVWMNVAESEAPAA